MDKVGGVLEGYEESSVVGRMHMFDSFNNEIFLCP
jgi:hypothetical protein